MAARKLREDCEESVKSAWPLGALRRRCRRADRFGSIPRLRPRTCVVRPDRDAAPRGSHPPMSRRRQAGPSRVATGRELNERIARWAGLNGHATETLAYYCECGDPICVERICLTGVQYERLRAISDRAAVIRGHQPTDMDGVVEEYRDYLIVTHNALAAHRRCLVHRERKWR